MFTTPTTEIAAHKLPVAAAPSTKPHISAKPCVVIQYMSAEGKSHFEKFQLRTDTSTKTAVFHLSRPKQRMPWKAETAHAAATIHNPAAAVEPGQPKANAAVAAICTVKRRASLTSPAIRRSRAKK